MLGFDIPAHRGSPVLLYRGPGTGIRIHREVPIIRTNRVDSRQPRIFYVPGAVLQHPVGGSAHDEQYPAISSIPSSKCVEISILPPDSHRRCVSDPAQTVTRAFVSTHPIAQDPGPVAAVASPVDIRPSSRSTGRTRPPG
jgi:hypothetical protein